MKFGMIPVRRELAALALLPALIATGCGDGNPGESESEVGTRPERLRQAILDSGVDVKLVGNPNSEHLVRGIATGDSGYKMGFAYRLYFKPTDFSTDPVTFRDIPGANRNSRVFTGSMGQVGTFGFDDQAPGRSEREIADEIDMYLTIRDSVCVEFLGSPCLAP